MCGFIGAFAEPGTPVDTKALGRGMNLIRHRGPDADDLICLNTRSGETVPNDNDAQDANLGMGFRRLSIIDLSANASQPMSNADNSVHMVFNGEIYNYLELKAQLTNQDYPFKSRSDSEVILALYDEMGEKMFSRLNGMFSIVLWDQNKGRLIFARDRLGIKPLYYTFSGSTLVFSSEIKALLTYPGVRRAIDPTAFIQHFTFHFPMGTRTIFDDIHALEGGTFAVFDGQALDVKRFWELEFNPVGRPKGEAAVQLRETIEGAVKRQIRSDVPVGAFLSGGMDTGAVAVLAHRNVETLHTFTCGFNTEGMDGDERFFDEREEARTFSKLLDTVHHEREVVPGDLERLLPMVAWHLEDPRVGISYQIAAMAQTVRESVPVVLSGTGGDELFGGYPWRYEQIMGVENPAEFDHIYYGIWNRIVPEARHREVFTRNVLNNVEENSPAASFDRLMSRCNTDDPLHRALFFDTFTFLNGVLSVDDKLNMAHSVESRVPLLDNEVVDLMSSIPSADKYANGVTKVILKDALKGLLPDEVINRRKQGFTPPDRSWYRGPSLEFIKNLLLSERFLERGWFQADAVRMLLDEHLSGTHNHRFLIWSMMMFELINRQFIDAAELKAPV